MLSVTRRRLSSSLLQNRGVRCRATGRKRNTCCVYFLSSRLQAGPGVHVIMMDQAAHHLDLFFEHPLDPEEVRQARQAEMDLVEEWVRSAYEASALRERSSSNSGGRDAVRATAASSNDKQEEQLLPPWLEHMPALTADW